MEIHYIQNISSRKLSSAFFFSLPYIILGDFIYYCKGMCTHFQKQFKKKIDIFRKIGLMLNIQSVGQLLNDIKQDKIYV